MRDKYGMQPEDFLNLYRKQNGKCAICGVAVPNLLEDLGRANGKIAVDHDHATGAVRGLLCTQCNLAIGYMQDNPDRLESAARYLRERSSSV